MTNKLTRLNIISKLNFENITTTQNFANIINDNNPYTKLTWNTFSSSATMECIVSDNIKYANLSSNYNRFRTQISYFNDKSFNFIIKFRLTELRSIQNIVTINNGTTHFVCNIKNTFDNGLSLYNSNGDISINCNYKFEADIDYVISISKDEDIYKVIINGTQYLCTENTSFKNNLPSSDSSYLILGCVDINPSNNINILRGRLYWANLSIGPTMIFNGSYTKYGSSLKSFLYFGNKAINDTATSYYAPLEAIEDSIITWNGLENIDSENINQNELICTGSNSFYTNYNINNPFTLTFKYRLNVAMEDVELISYYGYKLLVTNVVNGAGIPDYPEVSVNEYTTSALDFENGIIDEIPSTIWNKEGTADVTSVNKIFGENSFETKALGDSLYTNSNVITGGSTPFTIEFYALIKGGTPNADQWESLFNANSTEFGWIQGFYRNKINNQIQYFRSHSSAYINSKGKIKINYNDINKITITYDGSTVRIFVNDFLDLIVGTIVGLFRQSTYNFLKTYIGNISTFGIIDNINIHDGIATKVRDYDPYEEYLVVDLAFDGENNSTNIVDNGSLKSTWTVNGNAKISTDQKFDGFSSLYAYDKVYTNSIIDLENLDFTISFNFLFDAFGDTFNAIFTSKTSVATKNRLQLAHTTYGSGIKRIFFEYNDNNSETIFSISAVYDWQVNTPYKIDITRKDNTIFFYKDGILLNEEVIPSLSNENFILYGLQFGNFDWSPDNTGITRGYIKNFKIYKGVAVIPEDPTGKIQLDFDNNLVDKYGNSTWTNNGVTFDQVNSVKGYSAYFDSSNNIAQTYTNSELLNFENKNFKIELDYKTVNNNKQWSSLIIPQNHSYPSQHIEFSTWNSNTLVFQNLGTVDITITGTNTVLNQWYNAKLIRNNNCVYITQNNVITGMTNYTTNNMVNFNVSNNCTIGGINDNKFGGYIDNFKSYKEDLLSDLNTYTTSPSNSITATNNTLKITTIASNGMWAKFKDIPFIKNFKCNINFERASGDISFIFRTTSWTNTNDTYAYIVNLSDTTLGLAKGSNSTASSFTWLTTATFNNNVNTNYKLTVVFNETSIMIYINDILIINYSDSTYNIDGQIGFRSYGDSTSIFKDITIYDLQDNLIYSNNFKSKIDNVIDRPAVHLPLETNATNIGFAPLTINSVGSPTYHIVDGKKCIKFEYGNYLTIDSNNIFNLGTSSDFYIEMDIYVPSLHTSGYGHSILNNGLPNGTDGMWLQYLPTSLPNDVGKVEIVRYTAGLNTISHRSSNAVNVGSWNSLKFYRKNDKVYIELNGVVSEFLNDINLNFSNGNTHIGMIYNVSTEATMDGYMSNFKMFVGTSEIPETYNDKKVLDLDFKPTGKSYLFKDNNNKCVIHPVNITQRDYQNSQYCCDFNGTNQYLQLGKNDLLNFGYDDCVIEIVFVPISASKPYGTLIGNSSGSSMNFLMVLSNGNIKCRLSTYLLVMTGNKTVVYDTINTLLFVRNNNNVLIKLNDNIIYDGLVIQLFNLNYGDNTYIGTNGWDGANGYFSGTIYSIKVLRNTSDLSLLNDPVNIPVITPSETIYTLTDGTNTETISLTPELSDNEVTFYNKEFFIDVKVNDDNNVMSLPKNTSITDNTLTINNGFKGYIKDIKFYDTVIPFNDSDSFIDYDPYNTEFNQVQVEIISDDFTELNTMNIGNNNITGFLEGCILPISYDIIHKSTGAILMSGDTPYYSYNNIDIRYIDEYVIIDSNNKEYELINKSLDKEGFLIFILDAQSCQGNFCIRLYKHLTGKFVGEYEIINNQCQIDYLFIDERYDAVLFDRDSNIESKTLSDRIPEIKIV